MDVFGHPRAVTFFEESNIAGKFYSYVNAEGTVFTIFLSINSSHTLSYNVNVRILAV